MDEDQLIPDDIARDFDVRQAAETAGRVAASAVLATSLVAALSEPPKAELISLPEPTPIVQVYSPYVDDIEPAEDDEEDETSRWKIILKILRYLAVALLVTAAVVFGALKGCAGCSAGLLLPDDPPQQEQADNEAEQPGPQE